MAKKKVTNPVGRPKSKYPKRNRFMINLTDQEALWLRYSAAVDNRSPSEFIAKRLEEWFVFKAEPDMPMKAKKFEKLYLNDPEDDDE